MSSGGDLAPSLGVTEKNFVDQDFGITFSSEKISISRAKLFDDFF